MADTVKRPQRDTICAVIVTYNPDTAFPDRFGMIVEQVGSVVIVDNGSEPPALDMLQSLPPRESTHLIFNEENIGLASALNKGVERARELGADWVLLLDHDTEPAGDMVESLAGVYDDYPQKEKLAVIGSNYYNLDPQQPEYTFKPGDHSWVERKTVITAGSLIPLGVISRIGSFRDEFFIDHVDDEFCFRVRRYGFAVVMTRSALMKHAIGIRGRHRLPGYTVETSGHSPQRRYYMSRNFVVMAKEYLFREPAWLIWKKYKLLKAVILIAAFEKDRANKLHHMLKGVWHGVIGQLGKLD